jgi:hypothetical protein
MEHIEHSSILTDTNDDLCFNNASTKPEDSSAGLLVDQLANPALASTLPSRRRKRPVRWTGSTDNRRRGLPRSSAEHRRITGLFIGAKKISDTTTATAATARIRISCRLKNADSPNRLCSCLAVRI